MFSCECLVKLYKEICGELLFKGMLFFLVDWFLMWLLNIYLLIFLNIYCFLGENSCSMGVCCLILVYKLY